MASTAIQQVVGDSKVEVTQSKLIRMAQSGLALRRNVGVRTMRYTHTITPLGLKALDKYLETNDEPKLRPRKSISGTRWDTGHYEKQEKKLENVAEARTFNFKDTEYVPPKEGFVRNNSLKHIASRGHV